MKDVRFKSLFILHARLLKIGENAYFIDLFVLMRTFKNLSDYLLDAKNLAN
jgi:hypothetical protein